MLGHQSDLDQKQGMAIKAFSDAANQLVQARVQKGHHGYELHFWMSRATLETAVGESEAIGAIIVPLAKLIIDHHKKSKENEQRKFHENQNKTARPTAAH